MNSDWTWEGAVYEDDDDARTLHCESGIVSWMFFVVFLYRKKYLKIYSNSILVLNAHCDCHN